MYFITQFPFHNIYTSPLIYPDCPDILCQQAPYVWAIQGVISVNGLESAIVKHITTHILPGTAEDKVLESASLFDDGIVDSLGLQQMLVHLETEYAIEVDEDDLIPENFETVAGIVSLVEKLQAN